MNKKSIAGRPVQLRRPEYTGRNRRPLCTVVNLALAAVLTGVVALLSAPAGVVTAVIALTLIYFRGYLVPGTPELTKRCHPGQILTAFGKRTAKRLTTDDVDPGVVLVATGALVDSP